MEVTIETDGLDECIKALSTIPVDDYLYELMSKAEQSVNRAYATGITEGNTDYQSYVYADGDSATLEVSGSDVGFLEFGAGVATSADEFADQVGFDVAPGSYSEKHARMYSKHGYWFYGGERYVGIVPTRGMHKALLAAKRNITKIIVRRIVEYIEYGK